MSDRYYRLCNVRDSAHQAGVLICYDPYSVFIAPGLTGEIGDVSTWTHKRTYDNAPQSSIRLQSPFKIPKFRRWRNPSLGVHLNRAMQLISLKIILPPFRAGSGTG